MRRVAYGTLGLMPWEFARLTAGEYMEMLEAKLHCNENERGFTANCVLANVVGSRSARPNLEKLFKSLTEPKGKKKNLKLYKGMLEESHKRVQAQAAGKK